MSRFAVILPALVLLAAPVQAETRRIAIVVGNNAGSGDLPPLRFAENDAGKMARVLVELGEVGGDDVLLLQGRSVQDVERSIGDARERVSYYKSSPDTRTVLLFYFSGHSDGEAIELGPQRLAYARLKALLNGTGADVRVTIIDACKSGAGLREKGGKPTEAFTIKLADTLNASGEAFITSSAATEAALESNEVGGSYFTHNLISGLRGAADSSGDKQVTLAEAYRYAYDRTVAATAVLPVGAQHPNYDFKLSGQGELVLASLLKPSAVLVVPPAERTLVTDVMRDQVVVELPGGPVREVALAPGQYGVRVFKDGQSWAGRISLAEGARHTVQWSELKAVTGGVLVAKKGGDVEAEKRLDALEDTAPLGLVLEAGMTGRLLVPTGATSLTPKWQARLQFEPSSRSFVAFNLFGRPRLGTARLKGEVTLTAVGEMTADEPSSTSGEAGAQLRLGYRLALSWARLSLGLGVEAGPGFLMQLYGNRVASATLVVAPRLTLRLKLFEWLALSLDGEVATVGVQYADASGESFRFFPFPTAAGGLAIFF